MVYVLLESSPGEMVTDSHPLNGAASCGSNYDIIETWRSILVNVDKVDRVLFIQIMWMIAKNHDFRHQPKPWFVSDSAVWTRFSCVITDCVNRCVNRFMGTISAAIYFAPLTPVCGVCTTFEQTEGRPGRSMVARAKKSCFCVTASNGIGGVCIDIRPVFISRLKRHIGSLKENRGKAQTLPWWLKGYDR